MPHHQRLLQTEWKVALALLPAFLLGKWSFPVWVSFIVWAEYFALGAKLGTWKVIIPSIPFGAIVGGAAWISSAVALAITLSPTYPPYNFSAT